MNLVYILAFASCKFPFDCCWPCGCKRLPFALWKFTLDKKYRSNKCGLVSSVPLNKTWSLQRDHFQYTCLFDFFFKSTFFARVLISFIAIYNWGERCEILFFFSNKHTLQMQPICYLFSYVFYIASTICLKWLILLLWGNSGYTYFKSLL